LTSPLIAFAVKIVMGAFGNRRPDFSVITWYFVNHPSGSLPSSVVAFGIRRAELLPNLEMFSPDRLSRQLRRLLDIGVIKRITGTYRYYLTKAGRAATAAAERLKQAIIVPAMI
jgi:hypothetical protein